MTGETVRVLGSPTTVISLAATLANNAWTYSGLSGLTMTALSNSAGYPYAKAVLEVPDTFSAAPNVGGYFNLWALSNDVDSTNDEAPAPDSGGLKAARLVGQFQISAFDVAQRIEILIDILRFVSADFFIENKTGVTASYSSNPITVKITPLSLAPA